MPDMWRTDLLRCAGREGVGMPTARCCECRNGEHEDYSDLVARRPVTVRDPETGNLVQRGYLCTLHADMRRDDGYKLYVNGKKV